MLNFLTEMSETYKYVRYKYLVIIKASSTLWIVQLGSLFLSAIGFVIRKNIRDATAIFCLLARQRRASAIIYVVVAFCAVYILRIVRCWQNRIEPPTVRSFIGMHPRSFTGTAVCKIHTRVSRATPSPGRPPPYSAGNRWREFESQLLAYAIPSFFRNRRVVQFLQSLIYFRIRHAPSCPQEWRIPASARKRSVILK